MIKVDTNKIETIVIPSFQKLSRSLEICYEDCDKLNKIIRDKDFKLNQIKNELYTLKNETYNITKKIQNKTEEINLIEERKVNLYRNIAAHQKNINYVTIKTNNLLSDYKTQKLNEIKQLAIDDSQINTSGKFKNFTDFQNIMLSDLSLIELLWDGDEDAISNKTIGELYKESLNTSIQKNIEYDKLVFDVKEMLKMTKEKNWAQYRNLVLGKLVRYGFGDIKIKEKIQGKNGFDAFVLEDKEGNTMIYFPCTNLAEQEDFLYDLYPIMDSLSPKLGNISNIAKAKNIYNSQQEQADKLLKKYLKNAKDGKKVSVSGFSLGGSLAEGSYIKNYKGYSNVLDNIILYNPYHNRLTSEQAQTLKKDNKLKLYVCEGDSVSTVFNYNELKDVSKPIYINYKDYINNTINDVNNNNSALNLVVNNFKNEYCDNLLSICNKAKEKSKFHFPTVVALNTICKSVENIKSNDIDAVSFVKKTNDIVDKFGPVLKVIGCDISKYNMEFLNNFQYIETIFTTTHLTYVSDVNKNTSFNEDGSLKQSININGKNYEIQYPSFNNVSTELFGSDPYTEISNIVSDLENKT